MPFALFMEKMQILSSWHEKLFYVSSGREIFEKKRGRGWKVGVLKKILLGGGGVMGREWDDSLSSARELSVKPLPPPLTLNISNYL